MWRAQKWNCKQLNSADCFCWTRHWILVWFKHIRWKWRVNHRISRPKSQLTINCLSVCISGRPCVATTRCALNIRHYILFAITRSLRLLHSFSRIHVNHPIFHADFMAVRHPPYTFHTQFTGKQSTMVPRASDSITIVVCLGIFTEWGRCWLMFRTIQVCWYSLKGLHKAANTISLLSPVVLPIPIPHNSKYYSQVHFTKTLVPWSLIDEAFSSP